VTEFAVEVREGLAKAQKELPSQYLYDELGSALFEAITYLPEYGLTRADERLLGAHAGEIRRLLDGDVALCELGSGSGAKTRTIIEAFSHRHRPRYFPIDISAKALAWCRRELDEIAEVHEVESTYLPGIRVAASQRQPGERLLVLFLGSNIGNFGRRQAAAFLADLRRELLPGDALLLGADLVKPAAQLLPAYDDPAGVTAAFNRNLLGRINRELGADFDLSRFSHEARWVDLERRIEMHLRSQGAQTVTIPAAGCISSFADGETIWTESSHKYTAGELGAIAVTAGFTPRAQWTDPEWPFAENLWLAGEGIAGRE